MTKSLPQTGGQFTRDTKGTLKPARAPKDAATSKKET